MEALKKLEKILDVPPKTRERILEELRSHVEDATEELIEEGLPPGKASLEATRRLGPPEELAGDFLALNGPGKKTFLLILCPFLMALLGRFHRGLVGYNDFTATVDVLLVLACLTMLAGTLWGMVRPSKPAWLSAWLAGSTLAVLWLVLRSTIAAGGRGFAIFWWQAPFLLPATLNLWFYRTRPSHRLYVLALWSVLVLDLLFSPRSSGGPFDGLFILALSLRWLLHVIAWILLAAALAPAGRGNWAIYSSLSTFVYLASPVWWYLEPIMTTTFWLTMGIGPVAIWVLLYAPKIWMKVACLASAIVLIKFLRTVVFLRVTINGVWQASYAVDSILQFVLEAVLVVAPLLIWHYQNSRSTELRLAAK